MKHLYLIAIFIIASVTSMAQNNLPTAFRDIIHPDKFNNPKAYAERRQGILQLIKNTKGTYWVQDSSYYYDGNASDWELGYRWKFLSSEVNGNTSTSSYIRHFWNQTSQSWVNKDTILITSDDVDIQYLERPWNSQAQEWADTSNYYMMDENDNTLMSIYKGWDYTTNEFAWGLKEAYTYDGNGVKTDEYWFTWELNLNAWVLNSHYVHTYDGNGNLIETLRQDWDNTTNTWENYTLQLYTYDANDNEIQQIQKNWDSGLNNWVNGGKYTYTYDENGNKTEEFFQFWDSGTNDWANSSLSFFTYDGEGYLTQWLNQQWNGETGDWNDNFININTYDENGNLLSMFGQYWNTATMEWINSSQGNYVYDENGHQIQMFFQVWDEQSNIWANSWKFDFFWSEHEITAIAETGESGINIYPNPVTDAIYVNKSWGNVEVGIYDQAGRRVLHQKTSGNTIDISPLPKGLYILEAVVENGKLRGKLIVE